MEPKSWRLPEDFEHALLPIDFVVRVGGPLGRFYFGAAHQVSTSFLLRQEMFVGDAPSVRLLINAAKEWLMRFPRKPLVFNEPCESLLEVFSPGPRVVSVTQCSSSRLGGEEVLKLLAPDVCDRLGSSLSEVWGKYLSEMPAARVDGWDGLRYFGGFLRREGHGLLARDFQIHWSRAQALYSPQNEAGEKSSLHPGETVLNPTLNLVRSISGEPPSVLGIFRYGDVVHKTELRACDAVLIDEASEKGRLMIESLIQSGREFGFTPHLLREAFARLKQFGIFL